jgi:hypothetical protein
MGAVGYGQPMRPSLAAIMCLVTLLGIGLSGCTKCGWLWQQGPGSCHSETPR